MTESNVKPIATILPSHELTDYQVKALNKGIEALLQSTARNLVGDGKNVVVLRTDSGDYVLAVE